MLSPDANLCTGDKKLVSCCSLTMDLMERSSGRLRNVRVNEDKNPVLRQIMIRGSAGKMAIEHCERTSCA